MIIELIMLKVVLYVSRAYHASATCSSFFSIL